MDFRTLKVGKRKQVARTVAFKPNDKLVPSFHEAVVGLSLCNEAIVARGLFVERQKECYQLILPYSEAKSKKDRTRNNIDDAVIALLVKTKWAALGWRFASKGLAKKDYGTYLTVKLITPYGLYLLPSDVELEQPYVMKQQLTGVLDGEKVPYKVSMKLVNSISLEAHGETAVQALVARVTQYRKLMSKQGGFVWVVYLYEKHDQTKWSSKHQDGYTDLVSKAARTVAQGKQHLSRKYLRMDALTEAETELWYLAREERERHRDKSGKIHADSKITALKGRIHSLEQRNTQYYVDGYGFVTANSHENALDQVTQMKARVE